MTKNIQKLDLEAYVLFKNVDESILKLNPILEKYGYRFIEVPLEKLESDFFDLFNLRPNKSYEESSIIVLSDQCSISTEFFELLTDSPLGGFELLDNGKMYFLKRIKDFTVEIVDGMMKNKNTMKIGGEIQKFKNDLIKKLKYFKNGDIMGSVEFQIFKKSRMINSRLIPRILKPPTRYNFVILDEELNEIKKHLEKDLKSKKSIELAEIYFNSCYELSDYKTRFINLITSLESIFNRSESQISHIVARHLSLILSKDKESFEVNYRRIKKLYGIRSKLVHGQSINFKESLEELTHELQNYTRKAILFCMQTDLGKNELFSFLNSKGFEK